MSNIEKKRKFFIGKVVSRKMEKTSTVEIEVTYKDKRVHKVVRNKKKFQVHDPSNISNVGDMVEFYEGVPISKTKFMHINKVISKNNNLVDVNILEAGI